MGQRGPAGSGLPGRGRGRRVRAQRPAVVAKSRTSVAGRIGANRRLVTISRAHRCLWRRWLEVCCAGRGISCSGQVVRHGRGLRIRRVGDGCSSRFPGHHRRTPGRKYPGWSACRSVRWLDHRCRSTFGNHGNPGRLAPSRINLRIIENASTTEASACLCI